MPDHLTEGDDKINIQATIMAQIVLVFQAFKLNLIYEGDERLKSVAHSNSPIKKQSFRAEIAQCSWTLSMTGRECEREK